MMNKDLVKLADTIIKYSSGDNDEISPEDMMHDLNKLGYSDLSPDELEALDKIITSYLTNDV